MSADNIDREYGNHLTGDCGPNCPYCVLDATGIPVEGYPDDFELDNGD